MEFTKTLCMRRSTRAYQPEQITEEQLERILNAAAMAPVGMGKYERIQLRVVQDRDVLDAVNADYAASIDNVEAKASYGAPTVIFVLGRRDDPEVLLGANAACIVENMALAATDLGLGSVYLLGICSELKNSAQAAALLRIPPKFRLVSALAVGHPAQPLEMRMPETDRFKMIRI